MSVVKNFLTGDSMNATHARFATFSLSAILVLLFASCGLDQPDVINPNSANDFPRATSQSNSLTAMVAGYSITLSKADGQGNWVYTWELENTNPGNGRNNGTYSELSHFSLIEPCFLDDFEEIFVSWSWSTDGVNWNMLSGNPITNEGGNPNNWSCVHPSTTVLKFDNGGNHVWYRLVLNVNYQIGMVDGLLKGGQWFAGGAGCIVAQLPGIVCTLEEDVIYKDETAWGEGARFVDQGSWAMYFELPTSGSKTVDLIAGQYYKAGEVTVEKTNGSYTITISLDDALFEDVEENVKIELYQTPPNGNPSPGSFSFKYTADHSPFTTIITPTTSMNYIAVHCDVLIPVQ